ncbi:unnamed protein product [Schistosoma curassoni]|uniref:Uncharacterized protein n=1 Tax=Schistosoma curassoni TaxID=6186 RepID=A0A183L6G9_9TREM|nr:unnamed protein product [Schistosoma curassoni]
MKSRILVRQHFLINRFIRILMLLYQVGLFLMIHIFLIKLLAFLRKIC